MDGWWCFAGGLVTSCIMTGFGIQFGRWLERKYPR